MNNCVKTLVFVVLIATKSAAHGHNNVVVVPLVGGSPLPTSWTIPPSEFKSEASTTASTQTQFLSSDAVSQCYWAAVYLPDGVNVKAITGVFSVGVNNNVATVEMYRHPFADGTSPGVALGGLMASLSDSISPTATLKHLSDTTVINSIVDNSQYFYQARICLEALDAFWGYLITTG